MKVSKDFVLRKIADTYVVVPVGKAVIDFSGMINLNETGAFLFEKMQDNTTEQDLVSALMNEYEVDVNLAEKDVKAFISKIKEVGILE